MSTASISSEKTLSEKTGAETAVPVRTQQIFKTIGANIENALVSFRKSGAQSAKTFFQQLDKQLGDLSNDDKARFQKLTGKSTTALIEIINRHIEDSETLWQSHNDKELGAEETLKQHQALASSLETELKQIALKLTGEANTPQTIERTNIKIGKGPGGNDQVKVFDAELLRLLAEGNGPSRTNLNNKKNIVPLGEVLDLEEPPSSQVKTSEAKKVQPPEPEKKDPKQEKKLNELLALSAKNINKKPWSRRKKNLVMGLVTTLLTIGGIPTAEYFSRGTSLHPYIEPFDSPVQTAFEYIGKAYDYLTESPNHSKK